MVHIIVVSHSKALANAVVEFCEEMKGDDFFHIIPVSGIDSDPKAFGSDPVKIAQAVSEVFDGDGVLLLGDLGSSIMNIELALDFLPDNIKKYTAIADAPLVEGTLAAAAYNAKGITLKQLKDEAELAKTINKF